jgi:ABC-type transport system involved in multi-copper enzyme maturation permease subunit
MNGTLAVARYTLLDLSRRRILLVLFVIGALGIGAIGGYLKVESLSNPVISFGPGPVQPSSAAMSRLTKLTFITELIQVVSVFAALIAFAVGMTAIYHDLESGAAVGIFSKPVSRLAFTVGKVLAAVLAMLVIVGLLGLETMLAMALLGGGLEGALWAEIVAAVANAVVVMLVVLALSTWMNNIVAAVLGLVYNGAALEIDQLHGQVVAGQLVNNDTLTVGINILYWLVPHQLMSDAQRQLAQANFDVFESLPGTPPSGPFVNTAPGASGIEDIIWWAFLVVCMATLVYIAVRRRQV